MEHLRDCVHFRPRTQTIASALRVRSEASFAIHNFFRKEGMSNIGFFYIHTPIITGNDCEGAGELFEIKNSEEFFGKKAYLTVSGQLHGEIFASSLGRIYTFGPTFRAEKSHTQRHLAEFWMV
jgi:asparaginyl-tRNA synthetase